MRYLQTFIGREVGWFLDTKSLINRLCYYVREILIFGRRSIDFRIQFQFVFRNGGEKDEEIMAQFVKAATADQIQPGKCIGVKVEGVFIGIYNIEGEYYAMNNICPHLGGVLSHGFLDDNCITCPLHMWEFDVTTGKCVWPTEEKLPTYAVKVEGEDILVDVETPL